MEKYKAPNYRHISRLERLVANDALNIIASIEMKDKDISDPAEYNKMYDEEMRLGYEVMVSAFESTNPEEKLKYTGDADGDFISAFGPGDVTYYLQFIELKVTDFCKWAVLKGYNLPEDLAKLVTSPVCNVIQENPVQKSDENHESSKLQQNKAKCSAENDGGGHEPENGNTHEVTPKHLNESESKEEVKNGGADDIGGGERPKKVVKHRKKSGPKKCTLSMAVERAYLNLLERKQTAVLKPHMRNAFMDCFKEMVSEGNGNNDDTLQELISEVRKSKAGKYIIVTKDRPNKKNPLKIDEKSDEYDGSKVTRFLNSLRTHHPLGT